MWKCYLKSVSAGHILLTFIPASYDDLLLLNELDTRHPVAVNMPTANEKKEDVVRLHTVAVIGLTVKMAYGFKQ